MFKNMSPGIYMDAGAIFCIIGNFVPYNTKTLREDAHRCVWKMPLARPHPARKAYKPLKIEGQGS